MTDKKNLILVVDDNPKNIQFLGSFLSEKGYEVGIAMDGESTLAFVKDEPPDLILLDVMMPGMDGFEVCKTLKNDITVRHIPVIFLTAKAETDDIVEGFASGGVDYVTKPFVAAELLARIQTHLEIKTLRSLLPICASCKKVRDEEGLWKSLENYIETHSNASFSHGICTECADALYGDEDWYKKKMQKKDPPESQVKSHKD